MDEKKLTAFGSYLKWGNVSMEDAAAQLDVTRQYVWALATGYTTPGLKLAGKIEEWSKGCVTMSSWLRRA
jgi:hypothetical protein